MVRYIPLMLIQTSRSTKLPVALDDLKAHLPVYGTQDDNRLIALEWGAVEYIESQINKSLVQTGWQEVLENFPSLWSHGRQDWYSFYGPFYPWPYLQTPSGVPYQWGRWQRIYLERGPIIGTTSISYYSSANVLTTLVEGTDYYAVKPWKRPCILQPNPTATAGGVWPIVYFRPDAVTISYTAGYSQLPYAADAAIKLLVGAWNENREDFQPGQFGRIPTGVEELIQTLRGGLI